MRPVNEDLAAILGAERMQMLADMARLRRHWPHMVGNMLAASTEPAEIQSQADGSRHLVVAVSHSVMAQQIAFLRDEIRQACARQCQITRIARIFTRIQAHAGMRDVLSVQPSPRPVSLSEKKAIARDIQPVRQRQLRRAMFQARLAQLMWENT